jgi:hypothetical protein
MKWTKKEIKESLVLTPLFHELSAQERKNVINYVYFKYGKPAKDHRKRPKNEPEVDK